MDEKANAQNIADCAPFAECQRILSDIRVELAGVRFMSEKVERHDHWIDGNGWEGARSVVRRLAEAEKERASEMASIRRALYGGIASVVVAGLLFVASAVWGTFREDKIESLIDAMKSHNQVAATANPAAGPVTSHGPSQNGDRK